MSKVKLLTAFLVFCVTLNFAQVKIEGSVYDEYLEPFYNATIKSKDGKTFKTDIQGIVFVSLEGDFPQKITVSADGFTTEEIIISNKNEKFNVVLKESLSIDDIVVSASRIPERIIESPSDIITISYNGVKKYASSSIYGALSKLRGVQAINNSTAFKTINTRGFASFDNTKFVQLVDGIDMMIPASFLAQGDFGAPIDLDVKSIEILPGASSALYGANAYNGLMLVNTKNPFEYQGISVKYTAGKMDESQYSFRMAHDFSIREAYKFSESFAAKVNFGYLQSEPWQANDFRNRANGDLTDDMINEKEVYDGLNIYGDENSLTYKSYMFFRTRRTGFTQKQLLGSDFINKAIRFNPAIYLRPFSNKDLEFQLSTNISISDKIVEGGLDKYVLNDFYMIKSKFEFKGKNFFVRLMRSKNKTKGAFGLSKLGKDLNSNLLSDSHYMEYYSLGATDEMKKSQFKELRDLIDSGTAKDDPRMKYARVPKYYYPRSKYGDFMNNIKNTLSSDASGLGSQIYDHSAYNSAEFNYNFSDLLNKLVDFQLGGSFRRYITDSKGTVFNDLDKNIIIDEYGAYAQAQKTFLDDKLKLTASLRYDKSQNFEANYSPRLALNYILGENKNHVFRLSYQTGFRNPTLQEQYAYRTGDTAQEIIVGSALDNNLNLLSKKVEDMEFGSYMEDPMVTSLKDFKNLPEVTPGNKFPVKMTFEDIINSSLLGYPIREDYDEMKSFTLSKYKRVRPESVKTFEFGYKTLFNVDLSNVEVSFNSFYSKHENFISRVNLTKPFYGSIFPYGEGEFTPKEMKNKAKERGLPENDIEHLIYPIFDDKAPNRQYAFDFFALFAFLNRDYKEFSLYTNMFSKIQSYGGSLSIKTKVLRNFDIEANYSFMNYDFDDKDNGLFEPNFNVPKHTANLHISNDKVYKGLGFAVDVKWADSYKWVSYKAKAMMPETTLIDAQLRYKINKLNSLITLGGSNLLGKSYDIAPGIGTIGSTYYVSLIIQK